MEIVNSKGKGSESNRERGEAYLKEAGLLHRVKYHVGDALEIIDKVEGKFDIVSIDIEFSRTDFAASIVPVRDGVAVAYKM